MKDVTNFAKNPNVQIYLVGNKTDLSDKRVVSTDTGREYAEENGMFYFETSASTGDGIQQVMSEIVRGATETQGTSV